MLLLSKAEQAERYLREAIREGRWEAGDRLPSERELLDELGVSRTTLRDAMKVMSTEGRIVRKQRSGTFVAERKKAGTIAVIADASELASPSGYYIRRLIEEAQNHTSRLGYRAVLAVGHEQERDGSSRSFMASTHLFDKPNLQETLGALNVETTWEMEHQLSDAGIHCVTIGPEAPHNKQGVVISQADVLDVGMRMLRQNGHSDFAIVYYDYSGWPLHGIRRQMHEMNKDIMTACVGFRDDRLVLVPWSPTHEEAYETFKQWWARRDRPSAILFSDDAAFDVASMAILELGIKVPDELAIVVATSVGRKLNYPMKLSRIEIDPHEIVTLSCDMLHRLIAGEPVDEPVIHARPQARAGESL